MKFLDFFAGIGGFRLGMEAAGHECVGYVEWDKSARKSYESIHNTEGEWTEHDIRNVNAGNMPRADVFCLGFPCTDISTNGRGEGLQGARSSLFFSVTKLIRNLEEENKPTYIFIENVENLLSVNRGYDFLRLLIELDEIGYDAEWQSINAREHGLPQNRQRIFIIGHFRGRRTRRIFPIGETYQSIKLSRPDAGWRVNNSTKKGYDIATPFDAVNLAFPNSKTRRGRVGKGYLQTLDRTCSQAVNDKGRWRKVTPREAWRAQGFPDWAFDQASKINKKSQLYSQAGNSVPVKVITEIAKRLN